VSELIISNMDDRFQIESFIIDKLSSVGAGILDSRHPSFTNEEKLKILRMKYWDDFVADAVETGHFILTQNGEIKVAIRTINQDISVIAGYIFESLTVRLANEENRRFGYDIFKWSTSRKRLSSQFYSKYQTVGVGFPMTNQTFPGYYNPNFRQFDVMFLTMNEELGRPEPATIVNTTIPAGVQIKAITSNELTNIIEPLISGQYNNVITYLRHPSGEHSYEVCIREIKKLHRDGKITGFQKEKLEDSIGYPEMFGLYQRDVDDYYHFIRAWYNENAKEDNDILMAIGMQAQEVRNGSSFITVI
jgi:hypothetical protein